eukprot:300972_1
MSLFANSVDLTIFILSTFTFVICVTLLIWLMYEFWLHPLRATIHSSLKFVTVVSISLFILTIIIINIQTYTHDTILNIIFPLEAILFGITRLCIYGFFIVKLYVLLLNSLYKTSTSTYILLSILCIICGISFSLFYLDSISLKYTIIFGVIYIVFDFVLLAFLLYLYIRKLIKITVDQISTEMISLDQEIEITNKRDLRQLQLRQKMILNTIIALYLLTIISVFSHLLWEISEITKFSTGHHIAIIMNKIIGIINLMIDTICIFLSFAFNEYIYDKLCFNIHHFVQKKMHKIARRKILE